MQQIISIELPVLLTWGLGISELDLTIIFNERLGAAVGFGRNGHKSKSCHALCQAGFPAW